MPALRMPRLHRLLDDIAILWNPVVEVDDLGWDVRIRLELEVESGELVVSKMTLERRPGGAAVDADVLRRIPVARLIESAIEPGFMSGPVRVRETKPGSSAVTPVNVDELEEPLRTAVVYRWARFVSRNPTAAVAESAGITHAAAAKRVQRARQSGLIEPTTWGRKEA